MHHPWLQAALALLPGLPWCVGQQAPNTPSSPQSSSSHWIKSGIDLFVVDSYGDAIPKAKLTILNGSGEQIANGKTDEHGEFWIAQIPPGTYKITAYHDGFKSQETTVLVQENLVAEVTSKLQSEFKPNLRGDSAVELVVTDETAAVIQGAKVSIERADGVVVSGATDPKGTFECDGLAAGLYYLIIEAPGFQESMHRLRVPPRGRLKVAVVMQILPYGPIPL